ncbi:MAG: exodeoxyribonuclease V subunit gamma, partial [Methylophagaceae bacterium]
QWLNAELTAKQWQTLLLRLLDTFFESSSANPNDEAELLLIRKTLDSLVETIELAEFEEKISIDLVKEWFDGHLDTQQAQTRFMGNGVTFCGMVPMRSIPFKVVCLIGMNDGSYPRRQVTAGFDLMSKPPIRQGDRSQRDEDRYLFLESLLSARSHFYISYVGASIIDNSAIPPSVLVSDVRDVLKLSFETHNGGDIWQHVLTEHPLQAFSQRYFDNSTDKLFSYVAAHCPPVSKITSSGTAWFGQALAEPDDSWKTINVTQLLMFYRHPARFLLQQRLGLFLESDEEQLESREPFDLDGLQAWSLRQKLLHYRLNDKLAEALPLVQATGMLPQGSVGDIIFNEQQDKVEAFTEQLLADYPDEFLTPPHFELKINGFVLQGQLDGLTSDGLFSFRMAKSKGGELLAVWLQHLILNCIQPTNVTCESRWITEDKEYHFQPVENAHLLLAELLESYWQGLQYPLPLFSNTSYAFAKASLKGNKTDSAMFGSWEGGLYLSGEKNDLYYQQVYDDSPLDEQFKTLALAVYEPIQAHLKEGEL